MSLEAAIFHPEAAPARFRLVALLLNSGSMTAIQLGGIGQSTQYDHIHVVGQFTLGGTLSVSLINGFTPVSGTPFDILDWGTLSGKFSSLQLPILTAPMGWDTSNLYSTGVITATAYLAGDINRDGQVTVADISALMTALADVSKYRSDKNLTDPTLFKDVADVNQDGFVDNADIQALITLVANNIIVSGGTVPGNELVGDASAAGPQPVTAVPEPASIVLLGLGALTIAFRRRTRLIAIT